MVPEYLGDNLAQGINIVARSSDKTQRYYPKKVGEIGESRKGVAVFFPASPWCTRLHGRPGLRTISIASTSPAGVGETREKEKNGYPFTTFTDFSDFLGIILGVLSDDLATMLISY